LNFWHRWVGLPWAWGADPRDRRAACCFRTAQAAREELGLPWPADRMDGWYQAAQAGRWAWLKDDWTEATEEVDDPVPGLLMRFDNPDGSFGVGVLVEAETLVTVRHQGRLIVAPTKAIRQSRLYQVK
jgi:hypothetical protein